jgi:hypothetical protein
MGIPLTGIVIKRLPSGSPGVPGRDQSRGPCPNCPKLNSESEFDEYPCKETV